MSQSVLGVCRICFDVVVPEAVLRYGDFNLITRLHEFVASRLFQFTADFLAFRNDTVNLSRFAIFAELHTIDDFPYGFDRSLSFTDPVGYRRYVLLFRFLMERCASAASCKR